MATSRRVNMPQPVRRQMREDGRAINWYATEQEADDATYLLRELGQLDRESSAPLGRVTDEDTDGMFAVAS